MPNGKSQTLSLGLHVGFVAIVLLLTSRSMRPSHSEQARLTPGALHRLYFAAPQRAGGSNRTLLPAKHGVAPQTARRTFIAPVSQQDPKLSMPITVSYESPAIDVNPTQIGDPASKLLAGALGANGSNGIGDSGCCQGIGDSGSGKPGISGTARISHRITPPQLIYKVEPEFSEAARKAKYQGTVVLAIEVDASGHPRNLRVLEQLGLGLDEKAIEAVSQWRFRPGSENGKPVVTSATVEVSFRLM